MSKHHTSSIDQGTRRALREDELDNVTGGGGCTGTLTRGPDGVLHWGPDPLNHWLPGWFDRVIAPTR
jgi:hypothetical protein